MLRILALTLALAAGLGLASGQAVALELGLTPNQVVSLWTNVNDALLTGAEVLSDDAGWVEKMNSMAAERFEGKKPADVLDQVFAFRAKLDRLRKKSGLDAVRREELDDGGTITPSVVFLNSGHVLDGLVLWLIHNTPKEQLVSPFYTRHDVSGKTPSHAYGQVDLANRRIDRLLAKIES